MDGIINNTDKGGWKRIKKTNAYRFLSEYEDEVLHIIKSGHKCPYSGSNMYFVVFEDAHNIRNGETSFLNKSDIEKRFGIKVNF